MTSMMRAISSNLGVTLTVDCQRACVQKATSSEAPDALTESASPPDVSAFSSRGLSACRRQHSFLDEGIQALRRNFGFWETVDMLDDIRKGGRICGTHPEIQRPTLESTLEIK